MFLSEEPGDVANRAEALKRKKYADISATHHFVPLGIETFCSCSAVECSGGVRDKPYP